MNSYINNPEDLNFRAGVILGSMMKDMKKKTGKKISATAVPPKTAEPTAPASRPAARSGVEVPKPRATPPPPATTPSTKKTTRSPSATSYASKKAEHESSNGKAHNTVRDKGYDVFEQVEDTDSEEDEDESVKRPSTDENIVEENVYDITEDVYDITEDVEPVSPQAKSEPDSPPLPPSPGTSSKGTRKRSSQSTSTTPSPPPSPKKMKRIPLLHIPAERYKSRGSPTAQDLSTRPVFDFYARQKKQKKK